MNLFGRKHVDPDKEKQEAREERRREEERKQIAKRLRLLQQEFEVITRQQGR